MSEIQGRVKKLSIDKNTGEVYGFILDDVEGYFNYSLPQYRDKEGPWDEHPVGSIIKFAFTTAENGKRYVSRIQRCDAPTETKAESPPWAEEQSFDGDGVPYDTEKAAVVKAVTQAEDARAASIERQVAMKCAAEVASAVIAAKPTAPDSKWNEEAIAALIDLCLDKFLAATK